MRFAKSLRRLWKVVPFLVAALAAAPAVAQQPAVNPSDNPPGRVARLSVIQGTVSVLPSGANDWSQATVNYPLTTGDRIYTDESSRVELEIGNVAVRSSELTDLTVANLNDQVVQLGLGQGTIRVGVYELQGGDSLEVDTPNGALTLLEAGDYRLETYPNDNATMVIVNRGRVQVTGGDLSQMVEAGQAVKLTGTDPIVPSFVSLPRRDSFDQWCRDRDRSFTSSASAQYVGRDIPGYHDLDQYGTWQVAPAYGPVWYPSAVPAGWIPYREGRWVWIEPWGWTWVGEEPWGFCPYHYGRWVIVGGRWGWLPGPVVARPVYAPALVAFIGGPHFSISFSFGSGVGWFPLGPGEPYFPWYHHDDDYRRRVNITNVRNVTNITNITNVTNIQYVNRQVATTVVPTETFRSGQPIHTHVIQVNPREVASAPVIAHPPVAPAATALGGARPVPAPPIRAGRFEGTPAAVPRPQPGQRPAPSTAAGNPPYQPRVYPGSTPAPTSRASGPPTSYPSSTAQPAPSQGRGLPSGPPPVPPREAPSGGRAVPYNPPPAQPRVITRNPLPPPSVPFTARQPVMQEHPGRPLEPQQVENMRQGRPAGPMRDQEALPHAAPARQEQSRPAPPPRSSPSKSEKDRKH